MRMSFVQRDEYGNAMGVTIELDKTETEQDVAAIRKWYRDNGFKEGRTRKYSDADVARIAAKG